MLRGQDTGPPSDVDTAPPVTWWPSAVLSRKTPSMVKAELEMFPCPWMRMAPPFAVAYFRSLSAVLSRGSGSEVTLLKLKTLRVRVTEAPSRFVQTAVPKYRAPGGGGEVGRVGGAVKDAGVSMVQVVC
jgi:hypothetical protein